MKYFFFYALLFVNFSSFGQVTYYFSNSGNDLNNGMTKNSPFKTIDKLNQLTLQPGDKVLFHCNDIFVGQINIKNSGQPGKLITISSYDVGKKPIITGAKEVTGWTKTPTNSNIWQAVCEKDSDITDFYRNSLPLPLGRYPNTGSLTIAKHLDKYQMISKEPVTSDWKGAELVFKSAEYLAEKRKIDYVKDNLIKIQYNQFNFVDGWGYFIQNSLGTLDVNGEWYFDYKNKKIYLYANTGNPNNSKFEIPYYAYGIHINNANYISIQNIEINKTSNISVYAHNSSYITLNNLTVNYAGQDGITFDGASSGCKLTNNMINHVNNNGVALWESSNIEFSNNTIKNCGLILGRGKSDNGQYLGFLYSSKIGHAIISNNVIDSIGFNGINFTSGNVLIKNNLVSNFCLIKGDGGGIYTWNGNGNNNGNITITHNIVTGGNSEPLLTNISRPHVEGIYLDDCALNIHVTNNTVLNCVASGIYLHGTTNVLVDSNTFYNNNLQYYSVNSDKCNSKNNIISNNTFFSKLKSQPVAILATKNDTSTIGRFSKNNYISPDKEHMIVVTPTTAQMPSTSRMSLSKWRDTYSHDDSSSDLNAGIPFADSDVELKCNKSGVATKITLTHLYKDLKGKQVNKEITLAPYSSVILIKQN
ncbi:right-handed parallel beta-helix repeat-containing protein [Mucilaginibacter sp. FT3.2]|uniref:right-handed parallel beta-helix repeat-containing protein n=1 Tax=Mucilaginibacter sp. FT3.2 TaxID=2723090 RepID=UPI00161ACC83|nr:right-handed parallel beta-helix repeat-containing protein [Mucilaginibacter sp. FT3.2]MBB6230164.1 parallel beta-helix repeat protein [Mucilaginibacter sp. FT3.2]